MIEKGDLIIVVTQHRNLSVAGTIRARALVETGISQSAVAVRLGIHHTAFGITY